MTDKDDLVKRLRAELADMQYSRDEETARCIKAERELVEARKNAERLHHIYINWPQKGETIYDYETWLRAIDAARRKKP